MPAGVGDSIVEFAKAKGAGMVVIGSRGLGSIQRCAKVTCDIIK